MAQQQQQQQPFCYSLSAQAPQCKWGEVGGRWFGGGNGWMQIMGARVLKCVCACDAEGGGEDVISWYLSKHKQSAGTWVRTHPCKPQPHPQPDPSRGAGGHAGRVSVMSSWCLQGSQRTPKFTHYEKQVGWSGSRGVIWTFGLRGKSFCLFSFRGTALRRRMNKPACRPPVTLG